MKLKFCKICNTIIKPGLNNTCGPKCERKKQEAKEKERKATAKLKKSVSVSVLGKKADIVFGKYIRLRDSLKTTGRIDSCICITCGSEVNNIQCGHFVSRASKSTRWIEQNANGQCPACNCWGTGRQYEHGKAIDEKYGEGTADLLIKLGHEPEKITSDFLQEIIRKFTDKIEEIESTL